MAQISSWGLGPRNRGKAESDFYNGEEKAFMRRLYFWETVSDAIHFEMKDWLRQNKFLVHFWGKMYLRGSIFG